MDREVAQKVDQALKETVTLTKNRPGNSGSRSTATGIAKAEVELKQIESRQPAQQTQVSTTTEPRPSEVVKNVRAEVQKEPNYKEQ